MAIKLNTVLMTDRPSDEVKKKLARHWRCLLLKEEKVKNDSDRDSIVSWLLGEDPNMWERLKVCDRDIASQAIDYKYRILKQRYLQVSPDRAYSNLIDRLASIRIVRNKLKTWIDLSREKQRLLSEVLQEVVQEMLESDRYIQRENKFIRDCTKNPRLSNSLIMTSLEEYCLRPICDRPLLLYRIINFMNSQKRGGITTIPKNKHLRLINPVLDRDDANCWINLLDERAILNYAETRRKAERERLRREIVREFEYYLSTKVSGSAAKWFKLYLQGYAAESIAKVLDLPIKKVYRMREKITYHAIKIFAIKEKPELVTQWLEISLQEHNFGLTSQQWDNYWQSLTPIQQELINYLKQGSTLKNISQKSGRKLSTIAQEWSKIYLSAQQLRNS